MHKTPNNHVRTAIIALWSVLSMCVYLAVGFENFTSSYIITFNCRIYCTQVLKKENILENVAMKYGKYIYHFFQYKFEMIV